MSLLTAFLLVGSITTSGCDTPPPIYSQVAVFIDLTEVEERESTQLEDDALIERIFDLLANTDNEEDRNNGGYISFYTLSDESLLRLRFGEELEVGSRNENQLNRMDAVRRFRDSTRAQAQGFVQEILEKAGPDSATPFIEGYQQSHIVRPICEYLRTVNSGMNLDSPGPKYLIIFSDLLENSPVYSFFGASGSQGNALEALTDECSGVQGPVGIEYQVLQQELGIGNSGLSNLQFEASRIWRALFDELGLRENPALLN